MSTSEDKLFDELTTLTNNSPDGDWQDLQLSVAQGQDKLWEEGNGLPQLFHDGILMWGLRFRVSWPQFRFWLRRQDNQGRLSKGYWFQGNDHYAYMGLVGASGGKYRSRSVGIRFDNIPQDQMAVYMVVAYDESSTTEQQQLYQSLVKYLELELESGNYYSRLISRGGAQVFDALESFLKEKYEGIKALVKEFGQESILLELADFNKRLTKSLGIRKHIFESPREHEEPAKVMANTERNYWWVRISEDGISLSGFEVGQEYAYYAKTEHNALKEDSFYFEEITIGDLAMVGANDHTEAICTMEAIDVTEGDRANVLFSVVEVFDRRPLLSQLRQRPGFIGSEAMEMTGSEFLAKIKPDEYLAVMKYARELSDAKPQPLTISTHTEISGDSSVSFLNVDKIASLFTNTLIRSVEKPGAKQAQEDRFYGIFGRWGRGKTHFWNKIEGILKSGENKKRFITLNFHAWKYQDTPAIWAYLYETLADGYYYSRKSTRSKLWVGTVNTFQALWLNAFRDPVQVGLSLVSLVSLVWTVLIFPRLTDNDTISNLRDFFSIESGLSLGNTLPIAGFFISAAAALYKFHKNPVASKAREIMRKHGKRTSFKQHLGIQHETQEELQYLLKAWTYFNKKKIVLFVDDIDRCSHDKIIDIVDSIRVMINNEDIQNKLVVLAAIDERILFRAIRKKYDSFIDDDAQLDRLTYEYFDKLFIAGIKLSELDEQMKKEVLKGLTTGLVTSVKKVAEVQTLAEEKDNTQLPKGQPGDTKEGTDAIDDDSDPDDDDVDDDNLGPNLNSGKAQRARTYIRNISRTQLNKQESEWMEELIGGLEEATPRSIRNFTIKYRMARGLVELQLLEAKDEMEQPWLSQIELRKVLMEQILDLMNRKIPSYASVNQVLRPIFKQAIDMVTYYDGGYEKEVKP